MTGQEKNKDRDVKLLYEDFPYPRRDPESERTRLLCTQADYLDRINHYGWRGARDFSKPVRALVAGGGTGDATIFLAQQLSKIGGAVAHLEISEASMAIARQRAEVRGLDNIEWISAPIETLPDSDLGPFDYINSMGVIHHLADPAAGLKALADVLDPDGAMCIGVYGYYGRAPVRYTRRILQSLGIYDADRARQLDVTYRLLDQLPPRHPLKRSQNDEWFDMLREDPNELQDLFLHPRERSYTVGQLYDEAEGAGLHLNSFTSFFDSGPPFKGNYTHEAALGDPELQQLTAGLSARESAELAELVNGRLTFHSAYMSKHPDSVASIADRDRVPFFFFRPARAIEDMLVGEPGSRMNFRDQDNCGIGVELYAGVREVLLAIDGRRSVGEICDLVANSPDVARHPNPTGYAEDLFNAVFDSLNSFDWVLLGSGSGPIHMHNAGRFDRVDS
ncbi:MAG: class I SAM-dependent methyltransferase [Gammaproteobacteria bacterium]